MAILLLKYKVLTEKHHKMHPLCDIISVSAVIPYQWQCRDIGVATTGVAPQTYGEAAISKNDFIRSEKNRQKTTLF